MIIGYDFFCDYIYPTAESEVLLGDNDGIAFDTCNPINSIHSVKIENACFDELEILKDKEPSDINFEKNSDWTDNTVLLANFDGNLIGGNLGLYQNNKKYDITHIQLLRRNNEDDEWQIYREKPYNKSDDSEDYLLFVDRFIEAEREYEYAVRPIHYQDVTISDDITVIGRISMITPAYVQYDYAHLLGRDDKNEEISYVLIYNFRLGEITTNISANIITTLSGQYPITVYGESKYRVGNVNCLLVTEESATGSINIATEKILRNNISQFLSNKKPKILKFEDGTYLLVNISDNFTLTPNENLIGSYTLSFSYTEINDANNIEVLKEYGLIDRAIIERDEI